MGSSNVFPLFSAYMKRLRYFHSKIYFKFSNPSVCMPTQQVTQYCIFISDEGRQMNYNSNYLYNRRSQNDKLMPRRPPPPIPTNTYPRNISFSDDSVTANTTVASYNQVLPCSPSLKYETPLKQHELFTISGICERDTYLDTQITTPGLPYSVEDIETMSEMATTCRDDASTTTSGSYTINPDELCNEIDELFFKDVIV